MTLPPQVAFAIPSLRFFPNFHMVGPVFEARLGVTLPQASSHSFYDSYAHLDALRPNLIHSSRTETHDDSSAVHRVVTITEAPRSLLEDSHGRAAEFFKSRQVFPAISLFCGPDPASEPGLVVLPAETSGLFGLFDLPGL